MALIKSIFRITGSVLLVAIMPLVYFEYVGYQSYKAAAVVCNEIQLSDSIAKVKKISDNHGLKFSREESLLRISKNQCLCYIEIKDNKVIKKLDAVCKY